MKRSETTLVGLMLIAGSVALVSLVGLPKWDEFSTAQSQITALNDELKSMDARKNSLNAEIAQLEKNSIIPPDLEIETYTDKNREQIIKKMLDQIVNLATDAGNLFISLAPSDDKPASAPQPQTTAAKDGKQGAASSGNAEEAEGPPPPVLNQFSYELSVRGTYASLQNFLKSVAAQKALVEISAIKLENESASVASGNGIEADPFHPIRMTATVRLALQPKI